MLPYIYYTWILWDIYIYVSGNIIGIYQVVITCYNCDNSCKSGWWFQPTPVKK